MFLKPESFQYYITELAEFYLRNRDGIIAYKVSEDYNHFLGLSFDESYMPSYLIALIMRKLNFSPSDRIDQNKELQAIIVDELNDISLSMFGAIVMQNDKPLAIGKDGLPIDFGDLLREYSWRAFLSLESNQINWILVYTAYEMIKESKKQSK